MKPTKTLADRELDLVLAQNTTFDAATKAKLVRHASKKINNCLLICDILAGMNNEYQEIDKLKWR